MGKNFIANTQYNDLVGSAAFDFWANSLELEQYAAEKGIDSQKYNPIGLSFYISEGSFLYLKFFVTKVGEDENSVFEITFEEKFEEFIAKCKRLDIVLFQKGINADCSGPQN